LTREESVARAWMIAECGGCIDVQGSGDRGQGLGSAESP
jgi:hypothetical protein